MGLDPGGAADRRRQFLHYEPDGALNPDSHNKQLGLMQKFMSQLGLSPTTRSRVSTVPALEPIITLNYRALATASRRLSAAATRTPERSMPARTTAPSRGS